MSQELSSECSICVMLGDISVPRDERAAPTPSAGDVEVLGRVMGAGYDNQHRTVMLEIGNGDFPFARKIETGTELVDRAHVTRLAAERDALQLLLNERDAEVARLLSAVEELESGLRIISVVGKGSGLSAIKLVAKQSLNRAAALNQAGEQS